MKNHIKYSLVVLALISLLTPTATYAMSSQQTPSTGNTGIIDAREKAKELKEKIETQQAATKHKIQSLKQVAKQRLDDAKRKRCESHQAHIDKIMQRMDSRRQKAYDHITKIYEAAKNFYSNKQLQVEDYGELVASIDTAQDAAKSNMQDQQNVPQFNCGGDHPRADIVDFKAKRQSSIDAMRTYRQAVRDLIATIKAAAKEAKS